MQLTKIKRKELKRGDMYCEIDARVGRPLRVAFKDGDDPFFDPSTHETEVYRIDVPDYIHELTQFSWKLKHLDDLINGMVQPGSFEHLRRENEKLSATIDKVRVAMRKRGSVVAIQAVNQTIYEHDHLEDDAQCDVEKLVVDSVALDKIIKVVYSIRNSDNRIKEIKEIIEERGDHD